ncbi:MAG: YncE family protein [Candidatus Sulfotelmatobacter sp.]
MSFRRVGWVAAIALATWLEISCGQVYRPVVIPVGIIPPNPQNYHAVFGISANVPFNLGTALQIDVSGDSDIGQANMGVNPTHAAILPNDSRVFVASAGSLYQGDTDVVTAFFPAGNSSTATGLGTTTTITLPNIGAINPSTNQPFTCSYLPAFVATSQATSVFVANYGVENDPKCNFSSTDSVAVINTSQNSITNIAYLSAGAHPVAMVETPDALNLYVLNQGTNMVTDLSPQDLTTFATIPVGNMPAWAAVRPDSQRIYVVTQGDGQLYTIRTDTNAVIPGSPQSVGGAGANFVVYDKSLNRLYVTNPTAGAVYVFDATTDPPTPMGSATGAISIPAPPVPTTAPCSGGTCSYSPVMPVSVAALADGTRFYVASYVTSASSCPDPNVTAAGCVIPQVTVFDAGTLGVKTTVFPLLPSVPLPVGGVQPFALAPAAFCAPVIPYTPASARFRMSAAASTDSSRVYASMCDGGTVAIVATVPNTIAVGVNAPDTLVTDLPAPFSAASAPPNGEPPFQNPVFLLTGQ